MSRKSRHRRDIVKGWRLGLLALSLLGCAKRELISLPFETHPAVLRDIWRASIQEGQFKGQELKLSLKADYVDRNSYNIFGLAEVGTLQYKVSGRFSAHSYEFIHLQANEPSTARLKFILDQQVVASLECTLQTDDPGSVLWTWDCELTSSEPFGRALTLVSDYGMGS